METFYGSMICFEVDISRFRNKIFISDWKGQYDIFSVLTIYRKTRVFVVKAKPYFEQMREV